MTGAVIQKQGSLQEFLKKIKNSGAATRHMLKMVRFQSSDEGRHLDFLDNPTEEAHTNKPVKHTNQENCLQITA